MSLSTANNTDTTLATSVPSTSATEQVSPLPHNTQSLSSSPAPVAKAIVSEDIKGRDCDEETTSTVESKRVEVEHKTSCQSSSKSNSKGRSRSNKMQRGIIKSAGKKSSNSKSRK